MYKYLILYITTDVLVRITAVSVSAFDPAITYQLDDRKPLPSYIFEGEMMSEEKDEPMATSRGAADIEDDIWMTPEKKQQAMKKPKKSRLKPVRILTTQPQYSLFLLFCDESPQCSLLKEIWTLLPSHIIARSEELHKDSGCKKRL